MRLYNPPPFKNIDDARNFLFSMMPQDGVLNFAYLGVSFPGERVENPLDVTTYSSEWAEYYVNEKYHRLDPAITQGFSGILPYDWNSQLHRQRRVEDFFSVAREFGVGYQGVSIPIRGACGEKAIFSINSELSKKEWEDFKAAHLGELALFAYSFHLNILELLGIAPVTQNVILSDRERSVIKWASEGKTAWETAKILGITENTVHFYLRNAAAKLSASTKPQAVAIAIREGVLE
nr:LuxR family transcriptional regulator [Halomonas piscis]